MNKKIFIRVFIGFIVGVIINTWIFFPLDFISSTVDASVSRVVMVFIIAITTGISALIGYEL